MPTFDSTMFALIAQTISRVSTQTTTTTTTPAHAPARALALASPLERLGVAPDLARWIEKGAGVALTVLLTMLALRLVPWIERKLLENAKKATEHGATESEIDLRQRVETLTRVVTSLVKAAVLSLAIVMILGELGMEIKPLLAGAGIAGVAVGFGSQSIVKDFFAGFFILLEDQYDVGDTVTIGTVTGTVEQMTLRITVLRDINGTAYFIPNSAITQVANRTHGWARAAVDVTFQAKVRVGLARELLDEAAKHCKTLAPIADDDAAEIKIEGPTELDAGGTKWTVAVRAPATQAPLYKRALIEAVHHALNQRGYEPDANGRLGSS